mgnify:CR=1 FL=1
MEIDVIIPLYKPGKELFTLLDKLGSQSVPVHQVILLNTEEKYFEQLIYGIRFLETYQNIKVYHVSKKEFDHGGTRRMGVKKSSADVFVMMTQDAMPADRELLAELLKALEQDENIAAAYARQLPNAECSFVERYTRAFNYPDRSVVKTKKDMDQYGIKTFFCSNVCAAYKKDIYQKQGGFVRRTIFNEDMIYAGGLIQAGYGIAYAAEAKVIHSHNYNCMQQFHRNFDLGVSQAEHPEIFEGVPSEGEGMRLVKKTLSHLVRSGKIWLIPGFVMQCAGKYAGYLAGKNFRRLPKKFVLWCTMSPNYWK